MVRVLPELLQAVRVPPVVLRMVSVGEETATPATCFAESPCCSNTTQRRRPAYDAALRRSHRCDCRACSHADFDGHERNSVRQRTGRAVIGRASARLRISHSCAGFTLVEMLVVLTIIALVTAVALPILGRPPDNLRLEASARTLASALQELFRVQAVSSNTDVAFTIDTRGPGVQSAAVPKTSIDEDIRVDMTLAAPERQSATTGSDTIPDGMSTGGDIILRLRMHRAHVSVNWLTGETKIDLGGDQP